MVHAKLVRNHGSHVIVGAYSDIRDAPQKLNHEIFYFFYVDVFFWKTDSDGLCMAYDDTVVFFVSKDSFIKHLDYNIQMQRF